MGMVCIICFFYAQDPGLLCMYHLLPLESDYLTWDTLVLWIKELGYLYCT